MSEQIIDIVTRRAADAVSRRASLLALGGMALAAVTAVPSAAKGGKGGKGGKRRKKRKGDSIDAGQQLDQVKCASQGDQCRESLTAICPKGNAECLARLSCCDFFATCNAATGVTCIFG